MELGDAISLIDRLEKRPTKETWADLGCGSGLFTHALAHLLAPDSTIYAIDKNPVRLDKLPNPTQVKLLPVQLDFVQSPLPVESLDGVLMANSLHFVQDKMGFLANIREQLKPTGQIMLVEYDTDTPNTWVPYPTSYQRLKAILESTGFTNIHKLGERPSMYQKGGLYAIVATYKP